MNKTSKPKETGCITAGLIDGQCSLALEAKIYELNKIFKDYCNGQYWLNLAQTELDKLICPQTGNCRGGIKGYHGFSFEILHCYGNNAESAAYGRPPAWTYQNDNKAIDAFFNNYPCQMKASQKKGVTAFEDYNNKYPGSDGEVGYIVPKDIYDKYSKMISMDSQTAGKLRKPDYKYYRDCIKYKERHPNANIMRGRHSYKEIQREAVPETMKRERRNIENIRQHREYQTAVKYNPTVKKTVGAAGIGALSEGLLSGAGTAYNIAIQKNGKEKWNSSDTKTVAKSTAYGSICGGIRGAAVYQFGTRYPSEFTGPAVSAGVTFGFKEFSSLKAYLNKQIERKDLLFETGLNIFEGVVTFGTTTLGKKVISKQIERMTGSRIIGTVAGYVI